MIAFSCATCGMKFNLKEEFAGRTTRCPTCKQPLVVPRTNPTLLHVPAGQIQGMPSCLARVNVAATMTLPPPNVSPPDRKTVTQVLAGQLQTTERYVVEGEIARGGMGAILRAVDSDIRREVAVKYLLDQSDSKKKLRFIEEAQITGQLEHPNIVPIHELGVDAEGRMFFSMKLVKGRSLAQVVQAMWDSPAETETQFPLNRLLTIFVNVCNALAYAHARGVVHRDLKPANIMVGDFGEAYVMDWGLAKIVPASGVSHDPGLTSESRQPIPPLAIAVAPDGTAFSSGAGTVITSRELAADLTQEGSILGTLVYMPPEQAAGAINAIDQRSDVYSLGAILYELMALQAPISKDGNCSDILERVVQGQIMPPELANRHRARAGKVPPELSAIAMQALSKRPEDRYQSVETLRKDVELFLDGRSVSAKEDTRREQIVKFVKRNRAFSAAVAAALVLVAIIVAWSFRVNLKARRDAEQAQRVAETAYANYEEEQTEKEKRMRQAVPALVEVARQDVEQRRFDRALTQVKIALDYDPDNSAARLLKGQLLIAREEFQEGLVELESYRKKKPADADVLALVKLCSRPRPGDVSNLVQFATVLTRQESPTLAEELLRRHGPSGDAVRQQQLELYRKRIDAAWKGVGQQLTLDQAGRYRFNMGQSDCRELSPLKDMPLSEHTFVNMFNLRDLTALQGMPLTALILVAIPDQADLSSLKGLLLTALELRLCNGLQDLTVLTGMPLASASISDCFSLVSLRGLNGMPLTKLHLQGCSKLTDLSGLKGLKLAQLNLSSCPVDDLAPLRGMPLTWLHMDECVELHDLSPLDGMPLTEVQMPPRVTKGMEVLRKIKTLNKIDGKPAEQFWQQYDASQPKPK